MSDEQWSGTPEGQAVLRLLWDPPGPPARGPRPKVTLSAIVEAGIAVVRSDGLEALSMRKVAAKVGVGVMSLYTYVPGRSELVELMIDHVFAEVERVDRSLGWRKQLSFIAEQQAALFQRHPWILATTVWRMPMGPNVLDAEEDLYRALRVAGLTPVQIQGVRNLIAWHLQGVARTSLQEEEITKQTGVTNEDYWESRNSFWNTYFEPERYPTMVWIYEHGGFDLPEPAGDYAFERLLDGIQTLVDQN